ncbi:MAG: TATA-box-binding protein [Candidatus Micrarchaeota archaeon]|nr:TATA-box-binding protein [Candidatus Micrarchaeota archaeon]
MEYQIVNLVASATLKATLDLYNLAVSVPNIEYEPEQFPGAILKLKEPKVSMLLFKNGKVICSGASSEKEIELGIIKASRLIHEIQPKVKVLKKVEYTVVNLVATANLHQNLDLFHTALNLENVEYEPEQFPGAILRLDDPKITLLLFKNGKVICAGAKKEEDLKKGLEKAAKLISKVNKGVKAPAFAESMGIEIPKPAKVKAPVKTKKTVIKKTTKAKPKKTVKAKKAKAKPKKKAMKKPSKKKKKKKR